MGIGRVVATGAIVAAGLGVLSACGLDITKEKDSDQAEITEKFTSVLFSNDSGNVTITTGDRPSVAREIHYEDELPGPSHRVENGTLILDSCPVDGCWIDYDVVVPDGTTVDGEIESGNAEVSGVAEVNLRASSGDVTVRDIGGGVNVDASSGNVDLTGIGGAAQVQADSGNVTVVLAVPEDVRVQASSGNVEVSVPRAAYQVDAKADSGSVESDITDDDSAGHHLDLSSSSGNVTVTAT